MSHFPRSHKNSDPALRTLALQCRSIHHSNPCDTNGTGGGGGGGGGEDAA